MKKKNIKEINTIFYAFTYKMNDVLELTIIISLKWTGERERELLTYKIAHKTQKKINN
jgi:hypothetical protein